MVLFLLVLQDSQVYMRGEIKKGEGREGGEAYRHLVTIQGLLFSEGVKTLVERNITSPGRDAQTEVPERLESDGFMIAVSTAQGGLQLPHKLGKLKMLF